MKTYPARLYFNTHYKIRRSTSLFLFIIAIYLYFKLAINSRWKKTNYFCKIFCWICVFFSRPPGILSQVEHFQHHRYIFWNVYDYVIIACGIHVIKQCLEMLSERIMKSRNSRKNRQWPKQKGRKANSKNSQNTIQMTKDWVILTSLKTGVYLRRSWMVSSFCFTTDTRQLNLFRSY